MTVAQNAHAASQFTAEQARRVAENFIIDQIGDQVVAGDPWPARSAISSAWVVPLILTNSAYGPVGAVGVLVIDSATGQVIASTPADVLAEKAEHLYEGKGAAIEEAFRDLIVAGNTN